VDTFIVCEVVYGSFRGQPVGTTLYVPASAISAVVEADHPTELDGESQPVAGFRVFVTGEGTQLWAADLEEGPVPEGGEDLGAARSPNRRLADPTKPSLWGAVWASIYRP
jgi:hypothetical protein